MKKHILIIFSILSLTSYAQSEIIPDTLHWGLTFGMTHNEVKKHLEKEYAAQPTEPLTTETNITYNNLEFLGYQLSHTGFKFTNKRLSSAMLSADDSDTIIFNDLINKIDGHKQEISPDSYIISQDLPSQKHRKLKIYWIEDEEQKSPAFAGIIISLSEIGPIEPKKVVE